MADNLIHQVRRKRRRSMAGFDATFGDVSFDGRCSRNGLRPLVLGALGLATISGVAVFLLNARHAAAPNIVMVPPAAEPSAAPAAEIAANSFGAMIIEPGWIAKPASPDRDRSTQPGAEAAGPAPAPPIAQ